MKSIDVNRLQKLLNQYYDAFGAVITVYDENFNPIASGNGNDLLCSVIKENYQGYCIQSDSAAFERISNNGYETISYECHFGLIEIAHPIIIGNKVFAYLIMGPFRKEEQYGEDAKRIKEYCSLFRKDVAEAMRRYEKIPTVDDKKRDAIIHFIENDFDFKKQNSYLDVSENTFAGEISPYIIENLHTDISVESMCVHFGFSKKMLYSIFLRNTELSPMKYVNSERIKKAISLLINTDLPLPEIAERVGIPEYTYFSKVFKRYCGKNPSYYRSKMPKESPEHA